MFRCPVCTFALRIDASAYRCERGHSFDIASEGYVNLVTGSSPRQRSAGDSPEMVRGRRAFLDAGHYEPLRDALLRSVSAGPVLDLACGEGYYSRPLGADRPWVGAVDLSKHAVRLAARRSTDIAYAVANAFDLPIETASIETIVSVFGPVGATEARRVLTPEGRLLAVMPGPRHLIELKALLLADAIEHEVRGPAGIEDAFVVADASTLTFELLVAQPLLDALVTMTPLRWRANRERAAVVSSTAELRLTADFLLWTYVAA